MKKSAFTMIELIFVIVILGILSVVAIPMLTSVQDDARISSEEQGIAAVRGGITGLHTKRTLNPASAVTITITDQSNGVHTVAFGQVATASRTANSWTTTQNPWDISLAGTLGTDNTAATTVQAAGIYGTTNTASTIPLMLVAKLDNVAEWGTIADGNRTLIKGPASNSNTDVNAKINTNSTWLYSPDTGNMILAGDGNVSSY